METSTTELTIEVEGGFPPADDDGANPGSAAAMEAYPTVLVVKADGGAAGDGLEGGDAVVTVGGDDGDIADFSVEGDAAASQLMGELGEVVSIQDVDSTIDDKTWLLSTQPSATDLRAASPPPLHDLLTVEAATSPTTAPSAAAKPAKRRGRRRGPRSQVPSPYERYIRMVWVEEDGTKARKPYTCMKCEYRAARKDTLLNHIASVHHSEKPYGCPFEKCPFTTARKGAVARHFLVVHKDVKPHSCPVCDYRFCSRCKLRKHYETNHKGEIKNGRVARNLEDEIEKVKRAKAQQSLTVNSLPTLTPVPQSVVEVAPPPPQFAREEPRLLAPVTTKRKYIKRKQVKVEPEKEKPKAQEWRAALAEGAGTVTLQALQPSPVRPAPAAAAAHKRKKKGRIELALDDQPPIRPDADGRIMIVNSNQFLHFDGATRAMNVLPADNGAAVAGSFAAANNILAAASNPSLSTVLNMVPVKDPPTKPATKTRAKKMKKDFSLPESLQSMAATLPADAELTVGDHQQLILSQPVSLPASATSNMPTHNCERCEYRAVNQYKLASHIKIVHDKHKPFACKKCEFRTITEQKLRLHDEEVHLGIKKYACHLCPYRAARPFNLNVHVNNVHFKTKAFACSLCEFVGARREKVVRHLYITHAKQADEALRFINHRKVIETTAAVDAATATADEPAVTIGANGDTEEIRLIVNDKSNEHTLVSAVDVATGNIIAIPPQQQQVVTAGGEGAILIESPSAAFGGADPLASSSSAVQDPQVQLEVDVASNEVIVGDDGEGDEDFVSLDEAGGGDVENLGTVTTVITTEGDKGQDDDGKVKKRRRFTAEEVASRKHACSECGYRAARSNTLKMHVIAVHNNLRHKRCKAQGCNYKSARMGDLNRHMRTVHSRTKQLI